MLHMSAARSPSVRWGHRKLCPVAKLDNVACGNRTRLTITVSPHCHALPQLYHHHGSEEKRGVSGFSPLAQYNNMTEKRVFCCIIVARMLHLVSLADIFQQKHRELLVFVAKGSFGQHASERLTEGWIYVSSLESDSSQLK